MTKQELKLQYKSRAISAKDYFKRLADILKRDAPSVVEPSKEDVLKIFDGGLGL